MALQLKIKKPWGPDPAHPWLHSIARGSEAWVNPPKAKKEKVSVESGHHSLIYSFYYFFHNVKNENRDRGIDRGIVCSDTIKVGVYP
jgi:hypothetical protein